MACLTDRVAQSVAQGGELNHRCPSVISVTMHGVRHRPHEERSLDRAATILVIAYRHCKAHFAFSSIDRPNDTKMQPRIGNRPHLRNNPYGCTIKYSAIYRDKQPCICNRRSNCNAPSPFKTIRMILTLMGSALLMSVMQFAKRPIIFIRYRAVIFRKNLITRESPFRGGDDSESRALINVSCSPH